MFCSYHPKRIALNRCAQCQSGLCAQCEVFVKGSTYCPKCAVTANPEKEFRKDRKPSVAALLSLLFPGLGQLYNGERLKGSLIIATFWMIAPWVYGIYDAYFTTRRMNRGELVTPYPSFAYIVEGLGIYFLILISPVVAWRAAQHFFVKSEINFDEMSLKNNMLRISHAAEAFAKDKGVYPSQPSDLYFSKPSYLEEIYCGTTTAGYSYSCDFSPAGYRVTCVPASGSSKDLKKYTISTGGVWE